MGKRQFWVGMAWGIGGCAAIWAIVLFGVMESGSARSVHVCWRPGDCIAAAVAVERW